LTRRFHGVHCHQRVATSAGVEAAHLNVSYSNTSHAVIIISVMTADFQVKLQVEADSHYPKTRPVYTDVCTGDRYAAVYTGPVHTACTYGPYIRAVRTGRMYGCQKYARIYGLIFDTRTYGPYIWARYNRTA